MHRTLPHNCTDYGWPKAKFHSYLLLRPRVSKHDSCRTDYVPYFQSSRVQMNANAHNFLPSVFTAVVIPQASPVLLALPTIVTHAASNVLPGSPETSASAGE